MITTTNKTARMMIITYNGNDVVLAADSIGVPETTSTILINPVLVRLSLFLPLLAWLGGRKLSNNIIFQMTYNI